MRYYKRLSLLFVIALVSLSAFAAASSIVIRNAELQTAGDSYVLNAYTEFSLDESIERAVNKGVPLNFIYEFQLFSPRKYWFDDEIVTVSMDYTVSYHALSRQYLVSHNDRQTSFETLSEALLELIQVEGWKVVDKALLEKDIIYKAALLIRLDQSKLPKALQVEAIGSEDWNLTSQKFEWTPKELNK